MRHNTNQLNSYFMTQKNYVTTYEKIEARANKALSKFETELNRLVAESYKFCQKLPEEAKGPFVMYGTPLEDYLIGIRGLLDERWEVYDKMTAFYDLLKHLTERAN